MPSNETSKTVHLRPATKEDISRLTAILIESFPADPEWVYRYPYAADYPEDHHKYTLQRVGDYFSNVGRGAGEMTVAELSDPNASVTERHIVGWACWALPGSHGTADGDPEREMIFPAIPPGRRDADQAHVEAYFAVMHDKKATMFDRVYGEKQAHLCLLCVDPKSQGCGAGTALVKEGIEKARVGGYAITLFATGPGGRRLYRKLGFSESEWVTVGPVEGEKETIEFPGMVWKA